MLAICAIVGLVGLVWLIEGALRKFSDDFWERLGLSGLLSLGWLGFMALIAGLTNVWALVLGVLAVWGYLMVAKPGKFWRPGENFWPTGNSKWVLIFTFAMLLLPLAAVFAPTTSIEWDALAYHMAVPKLWALAGHIYHVVGIHHSNFPFGTEVLTMLMPPAQMEAGAKLVSFLYTTFGAMALYGLARRRYGLGNAVWSPLVFLGAPVVLWEAGTAYVDVSHGLFAGLAILYAAQWVAAPEAKTARLVGCLLGFCLATKYTGLQVMGLVVAGMVVSVLVPAFAPSQAKKSALVQVAVACLVALVLGGGWYVKTYLYTGNPVYPFFYEKLGGADWNQWRADLYKDEQLSFGVGRITPGTGAVPAQGPVVNGRDTLDLGHAILGLAYQPGRYTNPGQTQGQGDPIGSVGAIGIAVLLCVALMGPRRVEEKFALGVMGLQLLSWFFLSQQSRYEASLVVVGAGLVPALLEGPKLRRLVQVCVAIQALATVWIVNAQTTDKLKVDLGQIPADVYRDQHDGFSKASAAINAMPDCTKVALYDEVFGFDLNKPYFWANPGHSTVIPYEAMSNGDDYGAEMKRLGFSHVCVRLTLMSPEHRELWLETAGLQPGPGYTDADRTRMSRDLNLKWQYLTADAVKRKDMAPVAIVGGCGIFKLQ